MKHSYWMITGGTHGSRSLLTLWLRIVQRLAGNNLSAKVEQESVSTTGDEAVLIRTVNLIGYVTK